MQMWSCHFSAQKLLLPTAYRLKSKLINMEVNALEKLVLAYLLALLLNVIFPNPTRSLLWEPLHMEPSFLEFHAVRRGSAARNRKLSSNRLWQGSLCVGPQTGKSRSQQDSHLVEQKAHWHGQGSAFLLSPLPPVVSLSVTGRLILGKQDEYQ